MDSSPLIVKEIDTTEIATAITCDVEDLRKHISSQTSDFAFMSQNIRSVYNNIDDFKANLQKLGHDVDFIILTECRLNRDKPVPCLLNYSVFSTTHHLNQNDGVVVYVRNTIKPKVKEIKLKHASCLQVDVQDITLLGIYRSPSNTNADQFIDSLHTHLKTVKAGNSVVITGDINIDLIPSPTEQSYERNNRSGYQDMLANNGILAGHKLPTRGCSYLDHFMIKLNRRKISARIAVLNTSITDHLMIFLCLPHNNKEKTTS